MLDIVQEIETMMNACMYIRRRQNICSMLCMYVLCECTFCLFCTVCVMCNVDWLCDADMALFVACLLLICSVCTVYL